MAKGSGLGSALFVDGYDLSGDTGSLSSIHGGPALGDITGINKYAFERLGLKFDGGMSWNAWFNDATGQAHPVLKTLPMTDRIITYLQAHALDGEAAYMSAKQINYDGNLGQDGQFTLSVEAQEAVGLPLLWGDSLYAGKVTVASAAAGTGIDGGRQSAAVTITSSSVANPTVITTATPHGRTTGDTVEISGHSGSTPAIDGNYVVTVTGASTFTIPVNVTVGGTGGSMYVTSTAYGLSLVYHLFSLASGTPTFKLQHSADDVTYADITGATSGALASAPAAGIVSTATGEVIQRYVKAVSTGTFADAVVFMAFTRHLATTIRP